MYQNIFYDKSSNLLHIWDDKYGYFYKPYERYAYIKDPDGKYISVYGEKLRKINSNFNRYRPEELYEGDITPEIRYLIDNYTNDNFPSKQNIMFFDIEIDTEMGFPNINTADNPIISISFWIQKNNKYYSYVVYNKEESKINLINNNILQIELFKNERELLLKTIEFISSSNITIMSGWNSEGFDLPYLTRRIEKVLGKKHVFNLSPISVATDSSFNGQWKFAGFHHLDYLLLYKKFTYSEKSSYSLSSISQIELDKDKIKFNGTLDNLYRNNIDEFILYNLNDVKLLVELERKLKFIELAVTICHIGHIPYDNIYSQSRIVDSAVLTYMKQRNIVAPGRHSIVKKEQFIGAYVKQPQVGLHKWVYDLDFSSLYPSTIISLNISPETKILKIDNWDTDAPDNKRYNFNGNDTTKLEIKKFCIENSYCISANGVLYNLKNEGILPAVLKKWIEERKIWRKLSEESLRKNNLDEYKRHDIFQQAFKILSNSLYGILGLPTWRFFDVENAESVTLTGQSVIKFIEKVINDYYFKETGIKKDYVIYIDTDSTFVSILPLMEIHSRGLWKSNPAKYADISCQIVQEICNKNLNLFCNDIIFIDIKRYPHSFELKQELIAKSGLFIAKKRYGLLVIKKNKIDVDNELVVKGIDIVRSSYAKLFQEFLSFILTKILEESRKEELDMFIKKFKVYVKTNCSIADISTPTGVRGIDRYSDYGNGYKKGTPVHVKASINYNNWLEKNNLTKKYEKIVNDTKIKWIYLLENKAGISEIGFPVNSNPVELFDYIKDKIDYNRLFDSCIDSKINMFYGALNWITNSNDNILKFVEET